MSGAPASCYEQARRRVLAEAYAFALSVARRAPRSDESEPQPPTAQAREQTADDRR